MDYNKVKRGKEVQMNKKDKITGNCVQRGRYLMSGSGGGLDYNQVQNAKYGMKKVKGDKGYWPRNRKDKVTTYPCRS